MGDNKKHQNKATRKSISLETKMQVIRIDTGERQSQIGAALNLAASTIRISFKNREKKLQSSATATTTSSATGVTLSRNNAIEK
ncbi:hypothetical protein TNCV_1960731 [Trichonephila clavipes]|nr:hypothetical protein TNCV_1960731 [Trichonephila clavipes]